MKKGLIIAAVVFLILLGVGGYVGWQYYNRIYANNIAENLANSPEIEFYVHTGDDYEQLKERLKNSEILIDVDGFDWVAGQMNLPGNVYPGKYVFTYPMSNHDIITKLRSGDRTPVWVQVKKGRDIEKVAKSFMGKIEGNAHDILALLKDDEYLRQFSTSSNKVLAHIIPQKYLFEWNTSAEEVVERLFKEYENFWTTARKNQAAEKGLTPFEVSIVASIVEQESQYAPERPTIAGVYLNRLKKNWKLQADPTVIYAVGDFSIRRVLHEHLEHDSPYNTYKYLGLPPGPICIPSENSLKAVLNAEDHNYMYFCAKADFSGAHAFASTHSEHLKNAKAFQAELDRRGI